MIKAYRKEKVHAIITEVIGDKYASQPPRPVADQANKWSFPVRALVHTPDNIKKNDGRVSVSNLNPCERFVFARPFVCLAVKEENRKEKREYMSYSLAVKTVVIML